MRGSLWVGGSFFLEKLLSTGQQIVLARLLLPSDFGLLGIVLLAIGTLEVFTQTGVQAALIQRKEIDHRFLDTGWTISICRGLILFAGLYALAPYIAGFFHTPGARDLLRVLAFTLVLDGMANIGILLFNRDLDFRRQILPGQFYVLSNLVFSVGLALLYRSVWAMVIARVISSGVRTAVSYLVCTYRPAFYLDRRTARELLNFGKHVLGAKVLLFFITQGDDALVGKVLGAPALGFYTVAYTLSNTPATSITYIVAQVSFPAYARLRSEPSALRNSYHRALKFTALLALPLATGILMLAPDIIRVIYGEQWLPMVPAVQILCLFGAIRALGGTTGALFQGMGRPGIITRMSAFQLVFMALMAYPLTRYYGIWGTSLAVTISALITHFINLFKAVNAIGDPSSQILALTFPSLAASGVIAAFLFVARSVLQGPASLTDLCMLSVLSAAVYVLIVGILDKNLWQEIRSVFRLLVNNT